MKSKMKSKVIDSQIHLSLPPPLFSQSIFTNYFIAKELQLSGELDKSILKFKEIVDTSKDLKQINNGKLCSYLSSYLFQTVSKPLNGNR